MSDHSAEQRPTPVKALVALLVLIGVIFVFEAVATLFGVTELFAGYIFALYFAGLKHCDPTELPAAAIGMLGGLALASMFHDLPAQWGGTGLAVVLVLLLVAIYLLMLERAQLLINYGFMIMLSIGTIPAVQEHSRFDHMAYALLMAIVAIGAPVIVATKLRERKTGLPAQG